jgi:hypothetical protein
MSWRITTAFAGYYAGAWCLMGIDGVGIEQNELTGLERCPVERQTRLCLTLSLVRLGRAQANIHLVELEGILLAGTVRRHMLVAIQNIVYERRSFDLW